MFSMYICLLQGIAVAYVFVYLCSNNEVAIIYIYISDALFIIYYYY